MLKHKNFVGLKIGRWIVIEAIKSTEGNQRRLVWKCKCEQCGAEKNVRSAHFYKLTEYCYYCNRAGQLSSRWRGRGKISGTFWKNLKQKAKVRNLKFSITIEEIWDLFQQQDEKCILSGRPISFSSDTTTSDGTASLDRINSAKGYINGNVQWIHKDINQMKMNIKQDEFILFAKAVANHNLERLEE